MKAEAIFQKIWNAYCMKCETSYIERMGTIACRVLNKLNLQNIYSRSEFVSEHEGRSAWLLGAIFKWFPEVKGAESAADQMHFLLCHDIGEIQGGDKLDDGSSAHDDRSDEDAVFAEFFGFQPEDEAKRMQQGRLEFEDYDVNSGYGFAKLVEKADAILFQLFLETKGLKGSIYAKDPPSKQDIWLSTLTMTDCSSDNWCMSLRIKARHYGTLELSIVEEILKAEFSSVRGCIPRCMTLDVSEIEFPPTVSL